MKVYLVFCPCGDYYSYSCPVNKVFSSEQKAIEWIENYNKHKDDLPFTTEIYNAINAEKQEIPTVDEEANKQWLVILKKYNVTDDDYDLYNYMMSESRGIAFIKEMEVE